MSLTERSRIDLSSGQPGIVAGGRGGRLQDDKGAGRISDHSGTGFKGGEQG